MAAVAATQPAYEATMLRGKQPCFVAALLIDSLLRVVGALCCCRLVLFGVALMFARTLSCVGAVWCDGCLVVRSRIKIQKTTKKFRK